MDETSEAYRWCKAFRQLAKRTASLGAEGTEAECVAVLEDLFDIVSNIDVFVGGVSESLSICAVLIYEMEFKEATLILSALAHEELVKMSSSADDTGDEDDEHAEVEDEDDDWVGS